MHVLQSVRILPKLAFTRVNRQFCSFAKSLQEPFDGKCDRQLTVESNSKTEAFSSKLIHSQRSQPWKKAFACPTCSLRFSGWHSCLKHLKAQKHVRPESYATKEQLRQLLELPHQDAELQNSVVKLFSNPVAVQRANGEQVSVLPARTHWMYQCPLCQFACTKWPQMWSHVGKTGHISKQSYQKPEQLRLLLRKEKPAGNLALAFQQDARWEESDKPVLADGERDRVLLRRGELRLATSPTPADAHASSPRLVFGPNPLASPHSVPTNATPAPAAHSAAGDAAPSKWPRTADGVLVWTAGLHGAYEEALREHPSSVPWRDRLGLVAARLGGGVTREEVVARKRELDSARGGGGLDLVGLSLRQGYVAVDWECCGGGSGAACLAACARGRGRWVWMDAGAPAALLARAARKSYLKRVPRAGQARPAALAPHPA